MWDDIERRVQQQSSDDRPFARAERRAGRGTRCDVQGFNQRQAAERPRARIASCSSG
jgi:hypothetical protein